ncbi:MAG: NAD(P)H-hydrate dehydratase [Desulfomonilia bacterium]
MLAIIGTVPQRDFPITHGHLFLDGHQIRINDAAIDVNRGTAALMAAAVTTTEKLHTATPYGFLVGDIGHGRGSRNLYKYLTEHIHEFDLDTVAFHYLQPIAHWHDKVLNAIEALRTKPVLIADAGFMYAAKMSGSARSYDLFTPDLGELAFLADESSPHPFYTRGFILHDEQKTPELIERSYAHSNAARNLLVKGQQDYIVHEGTIMATVNDPSVDALEAIGGTGDTVTGIVSVLTAAGYEITKASELAARANRLAGSYANPLPSTSVYEIIVYISQALDVVLNGNDRDLRTGTSRA